MLLLVSLFNVVLHFVFSAYTSEINFEYIEGDITCDKYGHASTPEQLISTFEIESEAVEVLLTRNEIDQHILVYEIATDGSLRQNQNSNGKKATIYDSQNPMAIVQLKLFCQNAHDVIHRMTGFIVWNNKRYVINSDPDSQYLNTTQSARLKTVASSGNHTFIKEENNRRTRFLIGNPTYKAEVLIVVDYSLYAVFYNSTDADLDDAQRASKTQHKLEEYLGLVFHSVNVAYSSLTDYLLNIRIVPVALLISKDEHKSPWTLTSDDFSTLNESNDKPMLNVSEILDHLADFVAGLTIPKPDHALLFSRYGLIYNLTDLQSDTHIVGFATIRGICTNHAVSTVSDELDFSVVSVTSHEIGHSLGAKHDGDGNSCPKSVGNIMAPKEHRSEPNQWKFSSCSSDYFKTNIENLDRYNDNCLLTNTYSGLLPSLTVSSNEWYGQIYDADQQCEIKLGNGSYLDRGHYNGSSEYRDKMCLNLTCTEPSGEFYYHYEAGDGTTCGRNRWCMGGFCVKTSIPLDVSDECPQGDEKHVIIKNDMTCSELITKRPQECYIERVKARCCDICEKLEPKNPAISDLENAPSANDQCIAAYGSETKFCQNTEDYNTTFSSICTEMYCLTDKDNDTCSGIAAIDGTTCGHRKWCVKGTCVHNDRGTSLPETCLFGDKASWCGIEQNDWHDYYCYDEKSAKLCCDTCEKIKNETDIDCLFGDKSNWCKKHIPDESHKRVCYFGNNEKLCCKSCATYRNTSAPETCMYSDRASWCKNDIDEYHKYYCYNANTTKSCCDTCEILKNTTDQDCLYGDRHQWCKEEIPDSSRLYKCLVRNYTYECCETCRQFRNKDIPGYFHLQATPSADQQCRDTYGNESRFCQLVSDYSDSYAPVCNDLYCLRNESTCSAIWAADGTTCGYRKWCVQGNCVYSKHTKDVPGDCLYGDKKSWCKTSIPDETKKMNCYTGNNADFCCETCQKFRNESAPECLFGDKSSWCKTNIPDESQKRMCYFGNNAKLCCKTCAKYRNTSAPETCMYSDRASWCKKDIDEYHKYYCYNANTTKSCCDTCEIIKNTADQDCLYGDRHRWCKEEIPDSSRLYKCLVRNYTYECCETCRQFRNKDIPDYIHFQTTPSANQQCADTYGNGTSFCQFASRYNGSYSYVCSSLYCSWNKTTCSGTTAADGTTCGYRKWCVRGSCVYSNHTKDVPGDCLYGDRESWCKTSIPDESKKMMCYYGKNADSCCETCRKFRNESAPECLYGDKTEWCKKHIPDESHKRMCYYANNAELCCDSCAKYRNTASANCTYGDKSDSCVTDLTESKKRLCYKDDNLDLCCATCNTYRNDSLPGCEYGDRSSTCRRDLCHTYSDHSRKSVCCETCK